MKKNLFLCYKIEPTHCFIINAKFFDTNTYDSAREKSKYVRLEENIVTSMHVFSSQSKKHEAKTYLIFKVASFICRICRSHF